MENKIKMVSQEKGLLLVIAEQKIICPHCGKEIVIPRVLTGRERQRFLEHKIMALIKQKEEIDKQIDKLKEALLDC